MTKNKTPHIAIFAGTYEGRRFVEAFAHEPVHVTACVATEYGEILLPDQENLTIQTGRLDLSAIRSFLQTADFDYIIDATHPYAIEVTKNLKAACEESSQEYIRLIRASEAFSADMVCQDIDEGIAFLAKTQGPIFLTTGSKDLHKFAACEALRERLFVRILPARESLEECLRQNIPVSHIMALQGPFTKEHNLAAFKWAGAKYIVTKESGKAGGLAEKLQAAREAGAFSLVIGRPREEGLSLEQVIHSIRSRLPDRSIPKIDIIGVGPGHGGLLTSTGQKILKICDCILGARRLLAIVPEYREKSHALYAPEKVLEFIKQNPGLHHFALLVSGDPGFFSNARRLITTLAPLSAEIIPGISSAAYLAARLQIPWEDGLFFSLHGRTLNYAAIINSQEKTFFLLGGKTSIADFARHLLTFQLNHVEITLGENLSYEDETITQGTPADFLDYQAKSLPIVIVINKQFISPGTPGIDDERFIRGNVPMTKEEVRILSLSRLALSPASILYDIGAGTGSISIEAGRAFPLARIYAIEAKAEGIALIEENRRRFHTDNVQPVEGMAPAAFSPLPIPTHAFIGGSKGQMGSIVRSLLERNPDIRLVINLITLESLAEIMNLLSEITFEKVDIISVTAARSRVAGRYHLMAGQNPVYIITCQGLKPEKGEAPHA